VHLFSSGKHVRVSGDSTAPLVYLLTRMNG
jgi:hypothetical protein